MTMMLEELRLSSFKGFREFSVPCSQFTCLVGLNSRGKTSVLQAISLLHDILRFAIYTYNQSADFTNPQWASNPERAINRLNYADPDAIWLDKKTSEPCRISAMFSGGVEVRLEIKGRTRYELDVLKDGTSIKPDVPQNPASVDLMRQLIGIGPVFVPPIGPVSPLEQFKSHSEMQQQIEQGREGDSWRSRLFWLCNDGQRERFRDVVELVNRYVPEPMVQEPQLTHDNPPRIRIDFEEAGTRFDISSSGGGLRTLLNLAVVLNFAETNCFLFDEPESHLHSTLQRAIARMLYDWANENSRQVFVATHSADFIAELPSSSLIWIDRQEDKAQRCTEIGRVLADLGALSKADAIRACGANKILFLEGSPDKTILEALFRLGGSYNPISDPEVVLASLLDGKGNSTHLPMFCRLLHESLGLQVKIACIVDNDYELSSSASPDADNATMILSLGCKEIENYLIEPKVVHKAIVNLAQKRKARTNDMTDLPEIEDIERKLDEILQEKEITSLVRCQVLPKYRKTLAPKLDDSHRERNGEDWFESQWQNRSWRIRNCPGKRVLGMLRVWAQRSWKVTLTTPALVSSLSELPEDLRVILSRLSKHFGDVDF